MRSRSRPVRWRRGANEQRVRVPASCVSRGAAAPPPCGGHSLGSSCRGGRRWPARPCEAGLHFPLLVPASTYGRGFRMQWGAEAGR